MTTQDLSNVPFIYDANAKVGVLRGRHGTGELVITLVERHDDDSHTAVLNSAEEGGFVFRLSEEDLVFHDDSVEINLPKVVLELDPTYVRKFRAFSRGNYPTPDVAGTTLP